MRTHGTISCYNHARCRCQACRKAAREHRARYRTRNERYTLEVCHGCGDEFALLTNHKCEWAA